MISSSLVSIEFDIFSYFSLTETMAPKRIAKQFREIQKEIDAFER